MGFLRQLEAIAGLGVTITMPAGEQVPNVPLGSMVRPQALVEAEQRMANAGVSGSEATLRLQNFPEGGCDRSSTPAPEAVASGGAGEAQSRQGGLRADLERSAGGVDRQVDGAAYVPPAEQPELGDLDTRSIYTTPRSSQPMLRSLLGSPLTVGSVPSPTQLPRGLRWLEGVSNLFRGPADAPSTGSLLAPILANASSGYGAVAAEPARAQTTSTQQPTPFPGSAREAAGTLGQLASVSFPLGAQGGMHRGSDNPPSSHSSLPHDAIQAEVARQLEGIMARARQAEQENLLPSPATPDLASSGQQRPATEGQDQEFAAVEALPEQERLHVLGEALAARVRGYDSMYVGVIVDVLLQEPTTDILSMLRDPALLEQCVAEVKST